MKRLIFLIIFCPCICFSQEFDFQFESEGIPVEIDGWQPFCPWAGGDSETAPEFCDIDADGDLDLFVGSYWGTVSFIENDGTVSEPDFDFVTRKFAGIDVSGTIFYGRSDPVFVDIDNDGDYDVFTGDGLYYVHYWENIGTSTEPLFELVSDSLENVPPGYNKLSFTDIDDDGDYDMFIGNFQGKICFLENTGTANLYNFELVSEQFSGIDVGDCASPCFVDIDYDNDYDLFIGDADGHIHYYRNDGNSVQWDYTLVSSNFMNIDVGDYASPEFADVDGDGDFDMFVGREGDYYSNLRGDFFYYENTGTQTNPQYQFITKNYITLDEGHFSFPQFVDIDSDNDLDFITNCENGLKLFENIGDSVAASFQLVEENFQNIDPDYPFTYFVDIDADGDLDLFTGQSVIPGPPTVALYINEGTPEVPDLVLFNSAYISNPDFHVNVNPILADIDADGDQDLFISDDEGHFYYYQNDGDSTHPDFIYVTNQWQGLYFSPYGWRGMSFGDLDDDGDLDLLMNNFPLLDYFNLRFYRNIGTAQNAIMQLETNVFLPEIEIIKATPILTDIDCDGDLDIFCGGSLGTGGIMFFRNLEVNSVNREPGVVNRSFSLLPNYPNPFNTSTIIPFTIPTASKVKLEVYNLLGQQVSLLLDQQLTAGSYQLTWDASAMSSGVYLIILETPGTANQAKKVMLVK